METLRRNCAKVCEPSELQFGMVHGVGRGIGVLDGGIRRARDMGGFGGLYSATFTIGKCNGIAATLLLQCNRKSSH